MIRAWKGTNEEGRMGIFTEGDGEPMDLMDELKYLLHTLQMQIRAGCETEEEEAFALMRLDGILSNARDDVEEDMESLAEGTENKALAGGIRKALKTIRKMDGMKPEEKRKTMEKITLELLARKAAEADGQDQEKIREMEDALRRRMMGE